MPLPPAWLTEMEPELVTSVVAVAGLSLPRVPVQSRMRMPSAFPVVPPVTAALTMEPELVTTTLPEPLGSTRMPKPAE